MIEVGQIAEAAGKSDGANPLVSVAGVQKQAVCVSKALGEHVLGERGAASSPLEVNFPRATDSL
jgi:hypothetical protein